MADLIDLDAFVQEDIGVKLGGKQFKLPGDVPAETMVRISLLLSDLGEFEGEPTKEGLEQMLNIRSELNEEVLELFRVKQPQLETLSLNDTQVIELVSQLIKIYNARGEDEDDVRPTAPDTPKESSKSSKPSGQRSRPSRTRSRSSTSS